MTIEWPLVRRAMLTQINLFPENPSANCMSTFISAEQTDIATRCIKAFYKGLLWAKQFDIKGGYVSNRNFQRTFIIDDEYVLGVFDNRNSRQGVYKTIPANPKSTKELVHAYQKGQGNIKTLIVLEKDTSRLANSDAVGNQSKFLIDVVYPAIEGIRARYSGEQNSQHWQNLLEEAQYAEPLGPDISNQPASSLLHRNLLSDIYHDPQKADIKLAQQSPLQLFYRWNSPLNIEFNTDSEMSHLLLPWVSETIPGYDEASDSHTYIKPLCP